MAQAREGDKSLQLSWENLKERVSANLNLFEYYIFEFLFYKYFIGDSL